MPDPIDRRSALTRLAAVQLVADAVAALVETAGRASMLSATRAVLATVSQVQLTYAVARVSNPEGNAR